MLGSGLQTKRYLLDNLLFVVCSIVLYSHFKFHFMNTTLNATNMQEAIDALPSKQIKTPKMPVGIYIQEGENLYHWCQEDKEKLTASGLDWKLVEELPERCEALSYAQSTWTSERHIKEEAEKEWAEKSPVAYQLRAELLHTFRYAFRRRPDLLGIIPEISKGNGHADMLQDLNDLSVFGSDNPGPLAADNYDTSNLKTAAAMSADLSELLAKANGERLNKGEYKLKRDKAYTYLKQLVDEIRECGKYVFWREPERVRGYRSEYLRKQNIRRNVKNELP